jgi:hypothetical protein
MAEDANNIVLRRLAEIRGAIDGLQAEFRGRISALESKVDILMTIMTTSSATDTRLQHSVDRLSDRIAGLEHRLDPVDETT